MNTKIKNIPFLLLLLLVCACNSDDDNLEPQLNSVEFLTIGKDALHGNGDEGIPQLNAVISNTEDWETLMNQMNSVNNVTDDFTETTIDFDNYVIIAVFDQIYSYGGNSIEITNVQENNNEIIISIDDSQQTEGIYPVMEQPFDIVKIAKIDKPIVFE